MNLFTCNCGSKEIVEYNETYDELFFLCECGSETILKDIGPAGELDVGRVSVMRIPKKVDGPLFKKVTTGYKFAPVKPILSSSWIVNNNDKD